jgi:hypothetical protein
VNGYLQVTGPCRQDLGAQLPGHAVDGLLIKGRPLVTEFVAGQFDRGEQGGQTTHLTVQGRRRSLADAQGGQLGIGPGPLAAPPPAGAGPGGTVDRGDRDRQAAQEPESQPPRLWGPS